MRPVDKQVLTVKLPDRLYKSIGKVIDAHGTRITVSGLNARIGDRCRITDNDRQKTFLADVVGIKDGEAILFPFGELLGISVDAEVTVCDSERTIPFGTALLGHVFDAVMRPVDVEQIPELPDSVPLLRESPNPLRRQPITEVFETGIRAIDALMTMGVGQRTGIFATAGVGKSTFLAMLARNAVADVIVVGLIGERGREVREFVYTHIPDQLRSRIITVIATADRPALERVRAAATVTALAEGFRDQGLRVLLLMDSVTRYARALREIGLSMGEIPVRRGFPGSVFCELPRLFERAGNNEYGSITAFYTVLSEDDDFMDPIAEECRSLLDGHIILSRKLAERAHFPAIDVLSSDSRLFANVVSEQQCSQAAKIRRLLAKYQEIEFLVQMGEYKQGHDSEADAAINANDAIHRFLQQQVDEKADWQDSVTQLLELAS